MVQVWEGAGLKYVGWEKVFVYTIDEVSAEGIVTWESQKAVHRPYRRILVEEGSLSACHVGVGARSHKLSAHVVDFRRVEASETRSRSQKRANHVKTKPAVWPHVAFDLSIDFNKIGSVK